MLTSPSLSLPTVICLIYQALLLQPAAHLGLRASTAAVSRVEADTCMRCRTNLKKEKRVRNRVNAFRFKKGGFTKRRFNGVDYAAEQKKADEDAAFYALIFTHSAEEAAAMEAAAKEEEKAAKKEGKKEVAA